MMGCGVWAMMRIMVLIMIMMMLTSMKNSCTASDNVKLRATMLIMTMLLLGMLNVPAQTNDADNEQHVAGCCISISEPLVFLNQKLTLACR